MLWTSITDLGHGFEVALQPNNLLWSFVGVMIGNLVGVLPGMGVLSAVSILLPLTFGMQPVAAILMIAGIFYGAQYGGAICSILLNLPCHPPHAVTCLDGFPMTQKGKGGVAMALLLGALIIHNITPGPRLIVEHPDIFWGLIASFWIGNLILVILNVPMIGIWVRLLMVPYRYLYPAALFFICIGVFATRNQLFDVYMTLGIGVVGYILLLLRFEPAPMLLGFVLGPRFEDNFRRAMELSRGKLTTFVDRPISALFLALCIGLLALQIWTRVKKQKAPISIPSTAFE